MNVTTPIEVCSITMSPQFDTKIHKAIQVAKRMDESLGGWAEGTSCVATSANFVWIAERAKEGTTCTELKACRKGM